MLTVNLTTTFQRLGRCRSALTSLLLQSQVPDQINLWVSREPYLRDSGISDERAIEEMLKSLLPLDIEKVCVRWVSNTGPYRKLIPILREAGPNDIIVTADDDIFYGREWLALLLDDFDPQKKVAIAGRVRRKSLNKLGQMTSYSHWRLIRDEVCLESDYLVTFGGGAALTRAMFLDADVQDDSFLNISPTADDLWYTKLLERSGTSVYVKPEVLSQLDFIFHNDGLDNHNFVKKSSVFVKALLRLWSNGAGYFGGSVSNNDRFYKAIERYFSA